MSVGDWNKLYRVGWHDSHVGVSGWKSPDGDFPNSPPICHSVGWLVRESADMIVLAPHRIPEQFDGIVQEQVCGEMLIPRSAIFYMKLLVEKPE